MSGKLFEAALEDSVFMDHVQPVNGYGRRMGESVTLTRLSNVTEPGSGDLTEGERIPEDALSLSTTSITVTEIGRSIPYTSLSDDLSKFDITSPVQKGLRNQMKLTLDTKAATAFKTAQVKYIPTGLSSGTFDTDGTASTSATANMNVYHIEEIVDYMYDTLQCPQIGDDYVGIFRRLALRGIRRDPAWEEWHKYTDPQAKYNGETGRMEGMRMIETNHANALAKVGTNSVLGEGVVFGEDGIALAEVQTPELRAAMPTDFGRSKAVAWYGILEFGIIWDTANAGEARIVHVTSS
jgi:N4-gp56 family major capsid protein